MQDIPDGPSREMTVILITTTASLLVTVLGVIVSLVKDNRNRKWQIEDKKMELAAIVARAEAEATAQKIRTEAAQAAIQAETRLQTLQLIRSNKETMAATVSASNANKEQLMGLIKSTEKEGKE